MTDNERYLDLLAIFHYIVGGLTALFSCMFLIHLAMGIAILSGALDGDTPPPVLIGWIFTLVPAFFILAGWTLAGFIVVAGRKLKRRQGYLFCLVVAACECVFIPFGTILGIFTLVVLTREPVRELFGVETAPSPPPPPTPASDQ